MGFELDFWDYVTFAVLFFIGVVFLGVLIFLMGLPGRIAIARKHPEADPVYTMGWLGFLAVVPDPGVHLGLQADRRRRPALSAQGRAARDRRDARAAQGRVAPYDADGDGAGRAAGPERLAMMAG